MGTEGGAIYTYGDGFQFVRPWLTDDPNRVVSICASPDDKILVAFGDNSLAVLALPSLNVIDLLEASWISPSDGAISCVHVDEPSGRNYAYIGTTEGRVFIIEDEGTIRICELSLGPSDLGIPKRNSVITELQVCPGVSIQGQIVVIFFV